MFDPQAEPFDVEPVTQADYVRHTYRTVRRIEGDRLPAIENQLKITNGDVQALKLWRAFTAGGIAVLAILIVPIFLNIVAR